jgi:dihydroflavonol-4-reductase
MSDTVLVTGVRGYVGQHCAAELLRQGFRVRGSLRNARSADAVRDGIARAAPVEHLDFVELDLLADAGWDAAMAGCRFALHVASPYVLAEPRDTAALIAPAVEGTQRALTAARRAGIARVVVTSSVVAMNGHMATGAFGPDDWTDLDAPNLHAYVRSKTLAERAAWDLVHENPDGPELVTINPGPIYGPTLTGETGGESLKWVVAMLRGKVPLIARTHFTMVDVRDVALLHARAMTTPGAAGKRYVVASREAIPFVRIAEILAANGFPKVSTRTAPDALIRIMGLFDAEIRGLAKYLGKRVGADNAATLRDLEWTPIPFEQTVLDTAASLKPAVEA